MLLITAYHTQQYSDIKWQIQIIFTFLGTGSSDGVVVKLFACVARGQSSNPGLATTISEIGYLLLPSHMTEMLLKWHQSQPNPTFLGTGLYDHVFEFSLVFETLFLH